MGVYLDRSPAERQVCRTEDPSLATQTGFQDFPGIVTPNVGPQGNLFEHALFEGIPSLYATAAEDERVQIKNVNEVGNRHT